jgi:CRISPR system Cascade subunit CasD
VSRRGGTAATGTHIRWRHYWADGIFTVALALDPAAEQPDLARCAAAIAEPERPLFLGRKPCLPSRPLALGMVRAESLHAAIMVAPLSRRGVEGGPWMAWWAEAGEPAPAAGRGHLVAVSDERDWANQVHTGRRFVWESMIDNGELEVGDD